jgi:hypothetical protein
MEEELKKSRDELEMKNPAASSGVSKSWRPGES